MKAWVRDIYGGDEGRRNIRQREGWVWERYEGGWREDKYKGKGLVGGE